MRLTLALALRLIAAAEAAATAQGRWVTVAVVDQGGHLVALHRADQSTLAHLDMAIAKAWSAATLGLATEAAAGGADRAEFRLELRNRDPRRTFLRGGFPLKLQEELVGGIGVAGPSGELDVACGQAALATLGQE